MTYDQKGNFFGTPRGEFTGIYFEKSTLFINPLPHGTIYSSRIVMRLIPQVEGQNTRRFASWRFFD